MNLHDIIDEGRAQEYRSLSPAGKQVADSRGYCYVLHDQMGGRISTLVDFREPGVKDQGSRQDVQEDMDDILRCMERIQVPELRDPLLKVLHAADLSQFKARLEELYRDVLKSRREDFQPLILLLGVLTLLEEIGERALDRMD